MRSSKSSPSTPIISATGLPWRVINTRSSWAAST
jgi:hypothetical protein